MSAEATTTQWNADGRLSGPVHSYFGLSYSSYLVAPRVLLQSMPIEWQRQFVALMQQADAAFSEVDTDVEYQVTPIGASNRFARAKLPSYRHGSVRPDEGAIEAERARQEDLDG